MAAERSDPGESSRRVDLGQKLLVAELQSAERLFSRNAWKVIQEFVQAVAGLQVVEEWGTLVRLQIGRCPDGTSRPPSPEASGEGRANNCFVLGVTG